MNSKRKGKVGELELAKLLRALGFTGARRGQQFKGSPDSPDIADAIPGVHIECKRVQALNIDKAMQQAIDDAGHDVPVVMHRKNRGEWLATVRLLELETLAHRVLEQLSSRDRD